MITNNVVKALMLEILTVKMLYKDKPAVINPLTMLNPVLLVHIINTMQMTLML
jgi:hypothetical protein